MTMELRDVAAQDAQTDVYSALTVQVEHVATPSFPISVSTQPQTKVALGRTWKWGPMIGLAASAITLVIICAIGAKMLRDCTAQPDPKSCVRHLSDSFSDADGITFGIPIATILLIGSACAYGMFLTK